MTRKNTLKAWTGLTIILLTLLLSGWQFFNKHFQYELEIEAKNSTKELTFISDLVKKRLQKKDYQLAQDFITSWGERTPDIDEIILVTTNGYELAHYSNNKESKHRLTEEVDIQYSYDRMAKLKLRKSLDNIYRQHQYFLYELLAGYCIIALILSYMTHTIVRIEKQKQQIIIENEKRILAEKELSETNKILQESEQNLAITLNSIGDGVITTDAKGLITSMNPMAEKFTGWPLEDAIDKPLKDVFCIIEESTRKPMDSPVDKVLSTGEIVFLSNHTILLSRNGTEYHIADSAAPIREGDNDILGIVLVFNDVTERKHSEEKIRTLFQAIEQSPISVTITDPDANIEYVNHAFEKSTGYQASEVIGKNPKILKSGKTSEHIYNEMWQAISNGNSWNGELINRRKNGETFWESTNIAPVVDDFGIVRHYLAVREDISLRKHQEEKILHQAHFDALTDLPNRFLSLDRLTQLINEAERNRELVAVLFLDLDDFKKINDSLGHDTGDKLLVEAADRLHNEVRSGDTVGRLGGDEFIILLGGLTHATDAQPVVENLLNRFRDAFKIDERELILTASVGIAIYPDDGDSPSELLRNADSAMYHSKEQGRNTYSYFTETMNQDVSRRLIIEEQMHGALDRGEFYLCYQPKIEIQSRNIIGVEALLRWNNPVLGNVNPDEFIPIAEQTGLIVPIGQYVLNESLNITSQWQQLCRHKFTMAVNLSPRQFRDPNLITSIEAALSKSELSGESLELEITEGVLLSGHSYIHKALTTLNNMGIDLSMDDFGTGYSSLSYLRSYPFKVLKIDRSFIADIIIDIADRELVNAAIAMAHSLGLTVVAEGVETEEQLKLLASQGCEIAQGYYFSKPVSADKITELLTASNSS
ncbi:MAG: EAL domain-containing protein [Gammaproteobacteria bacterium]|nr:EAL domain-containing protein [Gammaproteobacteria bacterium]